MNIYIYIYIAVLCIALALFLSCEEKKVKDDITKAIEKIGDKPTLTKPVLSAQRVRTGVLITFTKVPGYTYALKASVNGVTLDVSDKNTGQVRSTAVVSGVIVVATFDGKTIESDPIDFLLYVANKKALQDEIKKRLAEADGATADLNYIDTSNVTDMSGLFYEKRTFNGDVSKWDMSSVTDMLEMFANATAFNQPLNNWDVSSVTNMSAMFFNAASFNQDISGWVAKSGRHTTDMFRGATAMQEAYKPVWAR